MWDEGHEDDADNEGWDGDNDGGDDSPENVTPFTGLETTGTFFDGGTFLDGGGKTVGTEGGKDGAEGYVGWGWLVADYYDRIV